ncbi:DUF6470 family protein [Paenibacillus gansuensis]|uniref:DUF6470 family protein n=1 Tax=Paenibacillus gansuensis TaxID=306542 RepID=A0ABW5PJS7_9BACL
MQLPIIQMKQQFGRIGMESERAFVEMKQPRAVQDFNIQPSEVEIESPRGELEIDQSKAWEALTGGVVEIFNNRIYSNNKQLALQGIAHIVEKGNRMAAIHHKNNVIADMGFETYFEDYNMNVFGDVSFNNVDFQYTVHKPVMNYIPGEVSTETIANKPEFIYHPGKLSIYMLQYPELEITPPQINIYK